MDRSYCATKSGQIYFESEGKGEALICLHGMDSSSWEFQNLMPLLSNKANVIAVDSLGFGISDPAPAKWQSIEDWAGSIVEFMDSNKIRKANLLGHHMGSKIALEIAAAHPQRVDRLILSGCGIFAPNTKPGYDRKSPWPESVQTTTLKQRIDEFRRTHSSPPEIPVSGLHIREMWFSLVENNRDAAPESIQAAFIARIRAFEKRCTFSSGTPNEYDYAVEARAGMVKKPTLLIVGSDDCICPPICKEPTAIAESIQGCKTVHIKGAGMMGPSVHAADYAKAVAQFLKT